MVTHERITAHNCGANSANIQELELSLPNRLAPQRMRLRGGQGKVSSHHDISNT
jgi:hypothetical protein